MERMMGGRTRRCGGAELRSEHFGHLLPQIVYVQTVVSKNAAGKLALNGCSSATMRSASSARRS